MSFVSRLFTPFLLAALAPIVVHAQDFERRTVATEWDADALYDTGFAHGVMRAASDGIQINDMTLIENDAAGAGYSEKGSFWEPLHSGVLARKTIHLADPRTKEAFVVLYLEYEGEGKPAPYYIVVNGHRIEGIPMPWHEGKWHWIPVPVEYLQSGENSIAVGTDAAEGMGYSLLFARADEYERGGGAYTYNKSTAKTASGELMPPRYRKESGLEKFEVGKTSARSADGGQTWIDGALGPEGVSGEYTIRLSLTRHDREGSFLTLPIDLWGGLEGYGAIAPAAVVEALRVKGAGATPPDTSLEWGVRFADTPDPESPEWGAFTVMQNAAECAVALSNVPHRFMQVRVRLKSSNPLASPVFKHLRIERDVAFKPLRAFGIYARESDQPAPVYSSYGMGYEHYDRPELAQLWERLELGSVTGATCGDFERINLIRHHVSQQWYHTSPLPGYPEWDALAILDRRDAVGGGGMCIQFAITFMHALQSCGYQARHVNVFNHETIEVYVDDLGKWVLVDPESLFDSYEYRTDTGEPLNALDQHNFFLAQYGFTAERPIPWMSAEPWSNWPQSGMPETPQPLGISTFTDWINNPDPALQPPQHNLAGFFRITPRNDFYTRPFPRPLTQGSTYWPWNGYLCWYDAATPRKKQYSLQSDRAADFYPTLNRVHYAAAMSEEPGVVDLQFFTQTPNFVTYEVNVDDTGWREAAANFRWELKRSALNRIQMRVRNQAGVLGKPSSLEALYHYSEPYKPKETAKK